MLRAVFLVAQDLDEIILIFNSGADIDTRFNLIYTIHSRMNYKIDDLGLRLSFEHDIGGNKDESLRKYISKVQILQEQLLKVLGVKNLSECCWGHRHD